jgi:hypothetical protein
MEGQQSAGSGALLEMFSSSIDGAVAAMQWCCANSTTLGGISLPYLVSIMAHMTQPDALVGAARHFVPHATTNDECVGLIAAISSGQASPEVIQAHGMLASALYANGAYGAMHIPAAMLLDAVKQCTLVGGNLHCAVAALCSHRLHHDFDTVAYMLRAISIDPEPATLDAVSMALESLLAASAVNSNMIASTISFNTLRTINSQLMMMSMMQQLQQLHEMISKHFAAARVGAHARANCTVPISKAFFGAESLYTVPIKLAGIFDCQDKQLTTELAASYLKTYCESDDGVPAPDELVYAIMQGMHIASIKPDTVHGLLYALRILASTHPLVFAGLVDVSNQASHALAAIPCVFGEIMYQWSRHLLSTDALAVLMHSAPPFSVVETAGTSAECMCTSILGRMREQASTHVDRIRSLYYRFIECMPQWSSSYEGGMVRRALTTGN